MSTQALKSSDKFVYKFNKNETRSNFYALFMGILFSSLCIHLFVHSFIRLSVCPLQVKFFGQGSFLMNLKLSTHVPNDHDDMIFLILMPN